MPDLHSATPLTLRSGLTLSNRLVKAALAESLAGPHFLPDDRLLALYRGWSAGEWGAILTGNVQVDGAHLGQPGDLGVDSAVPEAQIVDAWTALSDAMTAGHTTKTAALMQLNHPGRQSLRGAGTRGMFGQTVAPSAVPLRLGHGLLASAISALVFGTPRALSKDEIADVVAKFARAAGLAAKSGFDGVELHGAHGYLLNQFLSAKTNKRTDEYGGSAANRARVVVEIVRAVRERVRQVLGKENKFVVGIKVNSADYGSKEELRDVTEQLKLIKEAGVDFVEISGGTYENPRMIYGDAPESEKPVSERTKKREAFFLDFANAVRKHLPDMPLMVTGGFRSREGIEAALGNGDCDLVGLGRPACLNPLAPKNTIFNSALKDEDAKLFTRSPAKPSWLMNWLGLGVVGAGAENKWYADQLLEIVKANKK